MPQKSNREYRDMVLAIVETEEEEKRVAGYATVFDEAYTLYSDDEIEIREKVAPTAFDGADLSDVIMQYNHEGRVFARTKNGTLEVGPDDKGLAVDANLGGTVLGEQIYSEIKNGYTDKMSYGYTVKDESWEIETVDNREIHTRTVEAITKVYDVSAVSIPANNATSISVRTLADGVIEKVKAERLDAQRLEQRRRQIEVRAKANGGL